MKMTLSVYGEQKSFMAEVSGMDKWVIGRLDPDTGKAPAIDLEPCRALEQGVSRRHAGLMCRNNTVQIIDLGSSNGTFVNEIRLAPSEPYRLKNGDMIRVGFLTMYIQLEHSPQTEPLR